MGSNIPASFSELATELRHKIYSHALPSRMLQVGYDFPLPFLPGEPSPTQLPTIPALPNLFYVSRDSRSFCLSNYVPFAYTYAHPSLDTLYFSNPAIDLLLSNQHQAKGYARSPLYPIALLDQVVVDLDLPSAEAARRSGSHPLGWMSQFGYPKEIKMASREPASQMRPGAQDKMVGHTKVILLEAPTIYQQLEVDLSSEERITRTSEVLFLRSKLENTFQGPSASREKEMEDSLMWIKQLQDLVLDVHIIRETQIHKVLAEVYYRAGFPFDEVVRIQEIMDKWTFMLNETDDKDLIALVGSELRKHRDYSDEEWLRFRLPTLRCVQVYKQGSPKLVGNADSRMLRVAQRVAREWLDADRGGFTVSYGIEGTTKALERAGIERFVPWQNQIG